MVAEIRDPETQGAPMAKRTDLRPVVTLRSTAGTGYAYVTRKNRRSNPDRLVLRKFDPVAREHVDFRETR
jgi:large subunit ribosomal protein L33